MNDHQPRRPKKPPTRPGFVDRLLLWLSTGITIDGLWVGTMESAPHPSLQRVEEALRLIQRASPLHYFRIIRHLQRVWVAVTPHPMAWYNRALNACMLDERFVLDEATTVARIASVIIHEATHARLENLKIAYDEKMRWRIEAICLRRELAFAIKLPDSSPLQDEITRSLEYYGPSNDYFSDANFRGRHTQEGVVALRYLDVPDWLIRSLLKMRSVDSAVRSFFGRFRT